MGISSNQARFLSLTARQVDLEYRVQQICQRRLRLASELENVATAYNNDISNRKLYTFSSSNSGIDQLSVAGIKSLKDTNGNNYIIIGQDTAAANISITSGSLSATGVNAITIGTGGTARTVTMSDLGLDATLTGADRSSAILEAAIRSGVITLAAQADEFTQTKTNVAAGADAGDYELKDWRTLPAMADELYKADNVDAENKYDKTVSEINAQDKKLQLEQTSIEVEYKAVASEKEAVKKILDTNAQSSFKYFS